MLILLIKGSGGQNSGNPAYIILAHSLRVGIVVIMVLVLVVMVVVVVVVVVMVVVVDCTHRKPVPPLFCFLWLSSCVT